MGFLDDWLGIDSVTPPDPLATAQEQYRLNKDAAAYSSMLNAIDQYGPYGSTTYQRRADGTPISQSVNLSPEVQQWLDSQFGASTTLNQAAQNQLGYLPTDQWKLPTDKTAQDYATGAFGSRIMDYNQFSDPSSVNLTPNDTGNIAQTSYDQMMALQQPGLDRARKEKGIELVNRGIPVGSEIYNDEMGRLDQSLNQAQQQASRQALLDAGNEQTRQYGINASQRGILGTEQNQQFNQLATAQGYGSGAYQTNLSNQLMERNRPYEEAAALMGTAPQFSTPSFQGTTATNVAAPDYSSLVANNYNTQVGNNNASTSGLFSGLGSIGSALMSGGTKGFAGSALGSLLLSDEDMKENRRPVDGETILDMLRSIPVDSYDYKPEARAEFGVPEHRTGPMAQDWAREFPEGSDGHMIDKDDILGKLVAAVQALDARTSKGKRYDA